MKNLTDEETAKILHRAIVTAFDKVLRFELDRFATKLGEMRMLVIKGS